MKIRYWAFVLFALNAVIGISSAQANDLRQMAKVFGAREVVGHMALSPDGTKIAFISPLEGQASAVIVANLAGDSQLQSILRSSGDPERLSSCGWVSNDRLLCSAYAAIKLDGGDITYKSRLFALNSDGSDLKAIDTERGSGRRLGYDLYGGNVIDWLPAEDSKILMMRNDIPEERVGTLLAQKSSGLGVDRVDTRTLRNASVESPKEDAIEFISDGRGTIRIQGIMDVKGTGYSSGEVHYHYRLADSRKWERLSDTDMYGNGFDPYGVDPDKNLTYGLKKLNGRFAAYAVALDGTKAETLVYAHPEVDIDGFIRIGKQRRIVGVTFATDRRQAVFFDPELKALPSQPLVYFVDASLDEQKLLLWAGGDTDPGHYYLFDKQTKRLNEILLARYGLEKMHLAQSTPLTYRARDGVDIPGYLTLPPGAEAKGLPAIVMPHGGPSSRDEWGFDWLAQFFANQGYAVLQPNFRGSSGYGDIWFEKNGVQSWKSAISDVNDAGRWLVAQGIADPARLSIVGWSYGGYAALQSAVVAPKLFRKIVAIAPVTDFERMKNDRLYWSDYKVVSEYIGSGPHLEEGSPARHADAFAAPVLMFHGTMDRNVPLYQAQLMNDRLKRAGKHSELIIYDKLDHYLDDSGARADMLERIGNFLKAP